MGTPSKNLNSTQSMPLHAAKIWLMSSTFNVILQNRTKIQNNEIGVEKAKS